ncbi:DNA ligase 3 [Teleopsis dalmanni]|uniref:DNA ligase 3 n=1 Tax=Teleopsis dalmanni TaxID=139649 RepID=UPI0018CDBB02|nr:DNA ligase 3 [Teleopsis dalmanni]
MYINFKNIYSVTKFISTRCIQSKLAKRMYKVDDNRLETFRRVCDEIAEERSYKQKAKILENFFKKGSDKKDFKGDMILWVQMLVPSASQRVYNLQNKQMLKLFARIFSCDVQAMHMDLEQEGDVSETVRKYFEASTKLKPQSKSTLYLQEVEEYLMKLELKSKEDEQRELLFAICKQATALDLKMIIRFIKQDLRINAGARHILDAFDPLAYPAYQSSRDLAAVVKQFSKNICAMKNLNAKTAKKFGSKVGQVQIMTPISPMLANACKSVEEAFKKSPQGLYSEIKYDGERVQIHKQGNDFKFFSRNLKPVMDHKIKRFKEFIPKAFPGGGDMILDSEIILVDTVTGELLPFGTLGAHKQKEYAAAEVCLFVFDCILFNGDDLTDSPFRERREILENNIKPIQSYVQLSESHFLKTKNELSVMTAKVLKANLEGVVLKNPTGTYQPGKRGWLKVKKDYLFGGKMADTADLVVLGAWYGSGKKGGILSIFLMGCYDLRDHLWKTVTKVHSGLDDATNEEIHEKLMKLMERADPNKLPTWFLCKKPLVPDYIAKCADKMPVWEITGAEFTKSEAHTAGGISIRFPRITKLRDDKSAKQANDLEYLEKLFEASKKDVNVDLLLGDCKQEDISDAIVSIESKLNLSISPTKNSNNDCIKSPNNKKLKKSLDIKVLEKPEATGISKTVASKDNKHNLSVSPTTNRIKSPSNKKLKRPLDIRYLEEPEASSVSKKMKSELKADEVQISQKQTKLNFFKQDVELETKCVKRRHTSGIFKNITAFFNEDIEDKTCIELFESNGGEVTKTPKNASLAFYKSVDEHVKLAEIRQTYKPSCRHISVDWVQDSLNEKTCKPYPLYALFL